MRAKQALAIVALTTTLVGCTSRTLPAATPTLETEALHLYTTTAVAPLTAELTFAYSDVTPDVRFTTRSGSYQAVRDELLDEATPYFLSSHLPADSPLWAAPIGQDATAIITHPDLNFAGLTLDQLRGIYEGRITRWDTIDGPPLPVTVISREDGSGTRAEFERQLMGRFSTTANARIAPSSAAMLDAIRATPGAIGYVSLGYLNATGASNVSLLAVENVRPSQASLLDNTYPLRSTLYVVGREEPQGAYRALIAWMQSPAGQVAIARNYAPVN